MNVKELKRLVDADQKGFEARLELKLFLKDAYETLQEIKSVPGPLSYIDRIYDDGAIAFHTAEEDVVWVHATELEKFFALYHASKDHKENLTRNMRRIEAKIQKHFGDFANNSPIYFVRASAHPGRCTLTVGTSGKFFTMKIVDTKGKEGNFTVTSEVGFEFTDSMELDDLFIQAKRLLDYKGDLI